MFTDKAPASNIHIPEFPLRSSLPAHGSDRYRQQAQGYLSCQGLCRYHESWLHVHRRWNLSISGHRHVPSGSPAGMSGLPFPMCRQWPVVPCPLDFYIIQLRLLLLHDLHRSAGHLQFFRDRRSGSQPAQMRRLR